MVKRQFSYDITLLRMLMGVLIFALSSSVVVAQPTCPSTSYAPQTLELEIRDGKPEFVDNACPGNANKRPGDICNKKGDRPQMRFKLKPPHDGWEFVRMELSHDGVTFPDANLPAGAYADFTFADDEHRQNGWPESDVKANGKQLWVNNDNCEAFDVHYQLLLNGPTGQYYVHPLIENQGIGNSP